MKNKKNQLSIFFQVLFDACFATQTLNLLAKCAQGAIHSLFAPERLTSLTKTTSSSLSNSHGIISTTPSSSIMTSTVTSPSIWEPSSSISGRGIQNRPSGLISEKDGDAGEEDGNKVAEMQDRELSGLSKNAENLFANDDNISAVKGPTVFSLESDSSLLGQRWTGSAIDSKLFSEHSLASEVSVKARFSLQPVSIGRLIDLSETSTTGSVEKRNEIERLKSILAERLTLTEGAAIMNEKLKENKQGIESIKLLCSNSKLIFKLFLQNRLFTLIVEISCIKNDLSNTKGGGAQSAKLINSVQLEVLRYFFLLPSLTLL